MKKTKRKSLVRKLLAGVFIAIFACTAAQTLLISLRLAKLEISNAVANYSEIVEAYTLDLESQVNSFFKALEFYTNSDMLKNGDKYEIIDWLHSQEQNRSDVFDYIMYCESDGTAYTDINTTTNISTRPYFKAIFEYGNDGYVDNPVISSTTGKPVIHITKAVVQNGRTVGLVAGVVNVESIVAMVNSIKIGKNGYAWLLASDGLVISHPVSDYVMAKNFITGLSSGHEDMADVAQDVADGNAGYAWVKGLGESKKDFIIYRGVDGTPWGFALSVPQSQIYEVITSFVKSMILSSVVTIVLLLVLTGFVLVTSLRALKVVEGAISDIASGNADLTKRIEFKSDNEIGFLVKGFNGFTEKLQDIVKQIKSSNDNLKEYGGTLELSAENTGSSITQILANIESLQKQILSQGASVEETAGAVNEIASNIESLNRMIENQTSGITQASAAMEEMISNIASINSTVETMSKSFASLRSRSEDGYSKQQLVNEQIEKIEAQSAMLQEANAVISSIAEQTNLLAMNAAIEAAHAGDAGKGFSVVADEIRKLSETSNNQSKIIGEQLNGIKDLISQVVNSSSESSETFRLAAEEIQATESLVSQIKNALAEQNEGSKQINDVIVSINNTSTEVRGASTEMSEGNQAILEEVKRLQEATTAMRESMTEMSAGAAKINETGVALNEVSSNVKSAIDKISEEIDQFKV